MSDNIEIKTHSNEVLDMKGNTLEKSASIRIERTDRKGLKRPDDIGSAILQARHLYNNATDVTEEMRDHGVDTGKSFIRRDKFQIFKIHYYAWGLFWTTIMKASRKYPGLMEWSPEMFEFDEKCTKCDGLGKIPIPPNTPEYDKAYEDFKEPWREGDAPYEYGREIAHFCSPCQGVGFVFNREKYQEKNPQ